VNWCPWENNRLDFKSTSKKPVKILRKFLNIVKIEANNRNRYSKYCLIMGIEGYLPAKLLNLPEHWHRVSVSSLVGVRAGR
jgi:hypothetical protein